MLNVRIDKNATRPRPGPAREHTPDDMKRRIVIMYNKGLTLKQIQEASGAGYRAVKRVIEEFSDVPESGAD